MSFWSKALHAMHLGVKNITGYDEGVLEEATRARFFFQFCKYGYYGLHHSNHFCMLSVSMFSVSLRVVMYFHAPFDFVL